MVPEPLRAWTDPPCAQGPGRTPDSPELQLHPPAVQQDGGGLVVDACERGSGWLKAKHFHSYAQVKGADKRNSHAGGERTTYRCRPRTHRDGWTGPCSDPPLAHRPRPLALWSGASNLPPLLPHHHCLQLSAQAPPLPKGWASRSPLNRSAAGSTHGLLALGLPSGSHSHTLASAGLRAKTQT